MKEDWLDDQGNVRPQGGRRVRALVQTRAKKIWQIAYKLTGAPKMTTINGNTFYGPANWGLD